MIIAFYRLLNRKIIGTKHENLKTKINMDKTKLGFARWLLYGFLIYFCEHEIKRHNNHTNSKQYQQCNCVIE